ncbi:SUKH-3 domain-containing protein [Nocardiopsis sp. CNT312]|uniref:SUKH-3 domain-containing protein n=1 Tax=Nocardiopsis sp. CNT312 TaxID=1137268 RepID=UPI0018CC3715|nr:SUKH-3 domain-containing protein [Nocardiopsis sp. CNT312]
MIKAMEDSGWYAERIFGDADSWYYELCSRGYPGNRMALDLIRSLGGLSIGPAENSDAHFGNYEPLNVDPFAADAMGFSFFEEMSSLVGEACFPVGEWLSYSSVFITASGRMMAGGLGYVWYLGGTLEEGVQQAVMADRDLICIHSDEGLSPWP